MPDEAPPNSLGALVRGRAAAAAESVAIAAPARADLSTARLAALCDATARQLGACGVLAHDRVATILPDGPEAAAAFVCVAAAAACAPLNPGLSPAEMTAQLDDLRPRAIVLPQDAPDATLAVARASGATLLSLRFVASSPAGCFELAGLAPASSPQQAPGPDDVALVLYTSGTTARPKRVGLTHANLAASANHVARALELGPADRCLNLMPLFHIHGLVAGVLASLAAGGSVACPGAFEAPRFFDWLDTLSPTWFTAVPTMHQAILVHAPAHAAEIARAPLRFIRSSSSPLPPALMDRLEAAFGAPVIEAYGMTEAAHQMTSNPLPPRRREPGSVGTAAGPELAIADASGTLLAPGETGEVVIRGPNLMSGYENAPEANSAAFVNGWFRTGDLGAFDSEGYLFLKGRLKELINRGGEKIGPREVEEVLLEHPAVAQAVAFPVPDAALGEVVGAAIVLSTGALLTARELRGHAAQRLASFKVPQHVAFVAEIPKGPTGKIQRAGLAERLGLRPGANQGHDRTPPRTQVETRLLRLWSEVLSVEVAGVHAHFLGLGGDSLTAMRMLHRVREELGVEASLAQFFETPTVAGLATQLEAARSSGPR